MITAYAANAASAASGGLSMILPLVLMFALMYFLMIKPQKKKQQEASKMRNSLKAGDKVSLYSGLIGTIVAVKDDIVTIESGPEKVRLDFNNWAIRQVVADQAGPQGSQADTEDDKEFERQLFGDSSDTDEDNGKDDTQE